MGQRATGSTPALPAGQRTPRFVGAASTAAGKAAVRLTTGLTRAVGALGHLELYAARRELHRLRGELAFLASHNALTALPNRSHIEAKIEQTIDTCIRARKPGAVMVLDIDALTYVNHSRGQVVGDEVLVRVSQLLRSALGPNDVVGRLGGDQFAAVLAGACPTEAYNAVHRILQALRREPITVAGDHAVRITASVGLAFLDPDSPQATGELLIEANVAMAHAKGAGRNRVTLYSTTDPGLAALRGRHTWVNRIEHALDNDHFTLHAQPVLNLDTELIDRYELLLRMTSDDGSLIMPAEFLPTAERTGLITRIDLWVIAEACRIVGEHQRAGHSPRFEVNLSGPSMGDPAVLDVIERGLAQLPRPSGLIIEVTETAAIVDIDRARAFAERLESLGCEFALDDFGAGYGSFYYLKHLPFDYLKIDGEFIRGLVTNRADQVLVRSLVRIADELGKRTVAEFVEDEATLAVLRGLGVDYAQGYHIGRPAALSPPGDAAPPFAA